MSFKGISIFCLSILSFGGFSAANAEESDIRYRSIVYFYPGTEKPSKDDISKYLNGFSLVEDLPESTNKAFVAFSFISDFKDSYPVPDDQYLSYFGRGVDKSQASSIQKSNLAIIVDVAYPKNMAFDGVKLVYASLHKIATVYGGLIWDSETRELFEPGKWKERRIDSWDNNIPIVRNHTVIHAYKNGEGVRAISLGMAKLGLPDIVVNNFSWSFNDPMGNLINLVAQSLVEGNRPVNKSTLMLSVEKLKDTAYKRELIETLKDNAVSEVGIEVGVGEWEEGDPKNHLMEIKFDRVRGKSLSEKHDNFLSEIFGWEDSVSYVKHNDSIREASERAKGKLSGLRRDFKAGLAPGEFIQVKAPFETPDGGNEWMWVEVTSWDGDVIKGLLKNEPHNVPGLRGGSEVVVDQQKVFDYIRNYPNGSSEGNETGALIMKYKMQTHSK